jgi:hypothetical protein
MPREDAEPRDFAGGFAACRDGEAEKLRAERRARMGREEEEVGASGGNMRVMPLVPPR